MPTKSKMLSRMVGLREEIARFHSLGENPELDQHLDAAMQRMNDMIDLLNRDLLFDATIAYLSVMIELGEAEQIMFPSDQEDKT